MIGEILSHYRMLEKIGCGGMGVVYQTNNMEAPLPLFRRALSCHDEQSEGDAEFTASLMSCHLPVPVPVRLTLGRSIRELHQATPE
jgi:hypothetical protein